jgi:hypothetical protein
MSRLAAGSAARSPPAVEWLADNSFISDDR